MATQVELLNRIQALEADISAASAQIAALEEAGDSPGDVADLQAYRNDLENQLFDAQVQLQNIGVVDTGEDPYVYQGESTVPPVLNTEANQGPNFLGQKLSANQGAVNQNIANQNLGTDWRVRLSLAPGSQYLYNATNAGILEPLKGTKGVIFPYTPTIQVSYNANYDPFEPTHSNYKIYQYKNSSVGEVTITADFTAQDTMEGAYVLAVIHFFRSVTKMFYGQDGTNGQGVKNGTPPPLCYLTGMGSYQFDNHPLVVSSFSMTYPNEVDYIRVGQPGQTGGLSQAPFKYAVDKIKTVTITRKDVAMLDE